METHMTGSSSLLDLKSHVPLRKATSEIISAGWGIVTEKLIQANQEIFRVQQPLINVISDDYMEDTCDNCLLWTGSVLRKETNPSSELRVSSCNGCKVVRYCSKACQTKAWRRYHKAECKIYGAHRSERIPPSMRAVIRLLHLRLGDQLTENQWSAILNLQSHKDKYKTSQGSLWHDVEANCREIKKWTGTDVEEDILENLTCIFFNNILSIETPEGNVIGSCLDPCAALMNHSCDPNAAVFFEGPELRVRSTGKIPAGEEITISYIDFTETFGFRQEELRTKYYFECNCKKCEKGACGPGELKTGDPERDERIKEAQDSLRALLHWDPQTTSLEVVENEARRICREGYPGTRWPCNVQPVPRLFRVLGTVYQNENLVRAFGFWLKTCFEIDPIIRPSPYSLRRVENFMHYLGVEGAIANLLPENDSRVRDLQQVKSTLSAVQYPHIKRFVHDSARGFGDDSTIAQVAKVWERRWNMMLVRQGIDCEAMASYWASSQGNLRLKAEERKLLEWADGFKSGAEKKPFLLE